MRSVTIQKTILLSLDLIDKGNMVGCVADIKLESLPTLLQLSLLCTFRCFHL